MEKEIRVQDIKVIICPDFDYWHIGIGIRVGLVSSKAFNKIYRETAALIKRNVFRQKSSQHWARLLTKHFAHYLRKEHNIILPWPLYEEMKNELLVTCRGLLKKKQ